MENHKHVGRALFRLLVTHSLDFDLRAPVGNRFKATFSFRSAIINSKAVYKEKLWVEFRLLEADVSSRSSHALNASEELKKTK